MVVLFENTMKIAGVVIPGQGNDILNGKGSGGQQKSCLVEPFHLQELLEGLAGIFFHDFADGVCGHVQLL